MIWMYLVISSLVVVLYLTRPLYTADMMRVNDESAREDYKTELARFESMGTDNIASAAHKTALQRQVLADADQHVSQDKVMPWFVGAMLIVMTGSAAYLYSQLGRADLSQLGAVSMQSPVQVSVEGADLADLVEQLEIRLAQDPSRADGWLLYARSLMALGRIEDALVAYERTRVLLGDDPELLLEIERVQSQRSRADTQP